MNSHMSGPVDGAFREPPGRCLGPANLLKILIAAQRLPDVLSCPHQPGKRIDEVDFGRDPARRQCTCGA